MKKHASRLLSTLLVLCMVLTMLPGTAWAAEANYDTIDIYVKNRSVWTKSSDWYFPESTYCYGLVDFEGDGVPELFSSGRGGTGLVSQNHYYKINLDTRSVYEMQGLPDGLDSFDLLSGTSIYQDKQTGQLLYYSSDVQRLGWQHSNADHYLFYMRGGALSVKSLWGWKCEITTSDPDGKYTYFYYSDSGNRVEVSESDWNRYQEKYWDQYTLLAEAVPTSEAAAMKAANDRDLTTALRGLYDELYQNISPTPDAPVPSLPETGTAHPNTVKVELDGRTVEFQMYMLKNENGGVTNYIKVRDLALAMDGTKAQFNVGWDQAAGKVNLETGKPYTTRNGKENNTPFSDDRIYELPANPTYVDGKASDLEAFVLKDDDGGQYTYYQLRDLGSKLGFNVSWTVERGIYIESDKPYVDERK